MHIPSPLFNCQQVTLLVERRADEVLPFPIRVQLWAHLRLCPPCRRYEAQSRFIARYPPLAAVPTPAPALPAAARTRLQQLLEGPTELPETPADGAPAAG